MQQEAKALLAEAARLQKEASTLHGVKENGTTTKSKKAKAQKT